MIARAKAAQLNPLTVHNLFCVAVAPFYRHVAVCIGVHEHVERAVARELGQEGNRGGDLSEDCGDLVLDFLFRLLGLSSVRGSGSVLDGMSVMSRSAD